MLPVIFKKSNRSMRTSRLDTYILEGSTANGLIRTNPYTVSGIVRVVFSFFFFFFNYNALLHYLHNLKVKNMFAIA